MRIESINVGRVETIAHRGKSFETGICKYPVSGPVRLTAEGIPGDAIIATEHHGGADQAVYAYSADDYDWWAETTGREYFPGLFGENLTIRDMPSDMAIGDRLLIGEVVLEATSARIPCNTFAARMQDSGFGMAFRKAERPGIYFRVLNEGEVDAGDAVTYVETGDAGVTVLDLHRYAFATQHDPATLRRYLEAPIAQRVRASIESKLASLE
jgi:MOSC domain-containing protein YiiM